MSNDEVEFMLAVYDAYILSYDHEEVMEEFDIDYETLQRIVDLVEEFGYDQQGS